MTLVAPAGAPLRFLAVSLKCLPASAGILAPLQCECNGLSAFLCGAFKHRFPAGAAVVLSDIYLVSVILPAMPPRMLDPL